MPTTAGGFPVPIGADPADVPSDMSTLAVAIRAALAELVPPGTLSATATASAPTGWLLCQGQAVSRTTYAALYAALGGASSPFGQGDGSTTFNVPDGRGRTFVGEDGTAGRLTANDALGQSGGAEKHTLSAGEMPSHTHSDGTLFGAGHAHSIGAQGNHSHDFSGWAVPAATSWAANVVSTGAGIPMVGYLGTAAPVITSTGVTGNHDHGGLTGSEAVDVIGATGSAGSGAAHNSMQPYQVVNWMVKT